MLPRAGLGIARRASMSGLANQYATMSADVSVSPMIAGHGRNSSGSAFVKREGPDRRKNRFLAEDFFRPGVRSAMIYAGGRAAGRWPAARETYGPPFRRGRETRAEGERHEILDSK